MMNPEDLILSLLIILLVLIVIFLLARQFILWYYKINQRLEAQRRTNVLLESIYDALIQGNQINAITAGQVSSSNATEATIHDDDIPDL